MCNSFGVILWTCIFFVSASDFSNDTTMPDLESFTSGNTSKEVLRIDSEESSIDVVQSEEVTTSSFLDKSYESGICQVYEGILCSLYIGNKSVFIPASETQDMLEFKLSNAFTVIANSEDLSPSCSSFAKPSLCYSAFPLCREDESEGIGKPRKICREDCEILENEMCSSEYAIAKRHPLIGKKLVLHECNELPPIGSKESEGCLKLGVPQLENIDPSHTCYMDNGQMYRGTESVTAIGHPCTPWSDQLKFKTSGHPELVGGHSFCRNPGKMMDKPWCFTLENSRLKMEICNVPQCGFSIWIYCIAAVASTSLLATSYIVYWFYCHKGKITNINQADISPGPKDFVVRSQTSSPHKSLSKCSQLMEMQLLLPDGDKKGERICSGVRAREYLSTHVKFLQELGEGAFGKVYKGEVNTGNPNEPPFLVAIKTLKENATPKTQGDFRREVELMTDLRHCNIVCLLGVILKGEPLCMLFEYMTQGDLHEFLISHSPRADVAGSDEGSRVLGQAEFLHIAIQIATGMEYLSSHHYVHRDLAARNCLVGDNLTVKISDFGLSRDIYSSDYYRVQSKSLLPVRWMPPESILYGKFTTESDVWSFGVVLWEIYSYGLQPYYGYSNQEVIDMIRSRQLLPCPEDCPSGLYSLMTECWHEVPNRRPHFPDINSSLLSWWSNLSSRELDDKVPRPNTVSEQVVPSTCFNQCPPSTTLHTGSLPSNYLHQHTPLQHIENQVHTPQMSHSHHGLPGFYQIQSSKPSIMCQRYANRVNTLNTGVANSSGNNSFGVHISSPAQLIVRLPTKYSRGSSGVESKISNI